MEYYLQFFLIFLIIIYLLIRDLKSNNSHQHQQVIFREYVRTCEEHVGNNW